LILRPENERSLPALVESLRGIDIKFNYKPEGIKTFMRSSVHLHLLKILKVEFGLPVSIKLYGLLIMIQSVPGHTIT